ncbi:MAG: RtcB family protein, partial [Candidatus Aenigmatarchaeota archaeon]
PGRVYLSEKLLKEVEEGALEQVSNVACLPGIQKYSLAMPDMHFGYGFCLPGNSRVYLNFGTYLNINEIKENQKVIVFNPKERILEESKVVKFYCLEPYTKLIKIKTKFGFELKATSDHPILTINGFLPSEKIEVGEKIFVSPFEGVKYEEPSDEIILSEEDLVKKMKKLGFSEERVKINLKKLKSRDLIPLRYSSSKLPHLLKLIGFLLGDGFMNFIGKRKDGIIGFASSKKENLELIRNDIIALGYTPSKIYEFKREKYTYYVVYVNASSLLCLLYALGIPIGKKVEQKFDVPKWIFNCKLWQIRLFLAAFFGAELRIPYKRKDRNLFLPLTLQQNKKELKNGIKFLSSISKLLSLFDVKSVIRVRKKGRKNYEIELRINSQIDNLIRFFKHINYEYNLKRRLMANISLLYLLYYKNLLEEKLKKIEMIKNLNHLKSSEIAEILGMDLRYIQFVRTKIRRGEELIVKLQKDEVISFENFIQSLKVVSPDIFLDEVVEVEGCESLEKVYDITVESEFHNFIANGIIVSNCIGGVAALDYYEGGISPGGVGYDINCLSKDAKILSKYGYYKEIREFENEIGEERIKCMNFEEKREEDTEIIRFIKIKPKNKVFKLRTFGGYEIIATEDHPFYTPYGMVPLKYIKEGDIVAMYTFKGVKYEEPTDEIIIDEEKIKSLDIPCNKEKVIFELKKRNLLPLRMNSKKLPILIKVLAYNMGDGTLFFTKNSNKGYAWFYGKKEDLELIRKDIQELGFKPSKVYSRKRKHRIRNKHSFVNFETVEYGFKVSSNSFVTLLYALGAPLGEKTTKEFSVPDWLLKSPLWYKRLFLACFFDAEMSKPKVMKNHNYTFYMPYVSINKSTKLIENGRKFITQIALLLREFGIRCKIREAEEYNNKKSGKTKRIKLLIYSDTENLLRLYELIGFEYSLEKKRLAAAAILYLRLKNIIVNLRANVERQAIVLYNNGFTLSQINEVLVNEFVNERFIERSVYEGRKTKPRISFNFPRFEEFVEKITKGLGNSGMVWDIVLSKEEIDFDDFVYDFTVAHNDHNFIANNFVVSNCGVRLLRTNLTLDEVKPKLKDLLEEIFRNVPSGVGEEGKIKLSISQLDEVLRNGAKWAVENGYGFEKDLEYLEENGCMKTANPEKVSIEAKKRGAPQLGTLGAGNHFLEIQAVNRIFLPEIAKIFGIEKENQICVMIHTGSRGLGHQVCTDYLRIIEHKFRDEIRKLPDRELAYTPAGTKEQEDYFAAMSAAANYAWANRQMITHWVRESFVKVMKMKLEEIGLEIIYDVAHNICKIEEHEIDGVKKKVFVHRKGATRCFPKGRMELPAKYRNIGQPVLVAASMATPSYVLIGTEKAAETFYSTAHGSGRVESRAKALREVRGEEVLRELSQKGILAKAASMKVLSEERPQAYKLSTEVVDVLEKSGISKKVVELRPIAVMKG